MSRATPLPTPERMEHRLRTALAEMGWGDAGLRFVEHDADGWPIFATAAPFPPVAVVWAAGNVACAERGRICWSCWLASWDGIEDAAASDCQNGRCHHLGPERPPRELLVPRR